jgi:hypothetical protein
MFESHAVDTAKAMSWAIDLTPLIRDDALPVAAYTQGFIDRFRKDVADRLERFS